MSDYDYDAYQKELSIAAEKGRGTTVAQVYANLCLYYADLFFVSLIFSF